MTSACLNSAMLVMQYIWDLVHAGLVGKWFEFTQSCYVLSREIMNHTVEDKPSSAWLWGQKRSYYGLHPVTLGDKKMLWSLLAYIDVSGPVWTRLL